MEIKDILALGEKIEIKSRSNSTIATIYHQGKPHARNLLTLLKAKGVSMPTKRIQQMAGMEEIAAPGQVHACCYAKLLFDRVTDARNKPSAVKSSEEIARDLEKELKTRPVAYFLADSAIAFSDPKVQAVLGAKKFVDFPKKDQTRIWESFGFAEHEDAGEK